MKTRTKWGLWLPVSECFPPFVTEGLRAAFFANGKRSTAFVSHHAILLGAETRTSSPVRMTRNERFESITIKNLYPVGEGSGYTGGITSSAADAIKAVEMHVLNEAR